MDGVLNVYKPGGPTSHDIVDEVRRVFKQRRVGHAGTLDPMATGVLLICLGKATRIVEFLVGAEKEYRARLKLGVTTDTEDSTGNEITLTDASHITREQLERVKAEFVGEISQVPPMVSAVKHQGKRLYELARQGKTVERKPRQVTVFSIDVILFTPGEFPEAEIKVVCSSGTYIRTLCADIGDALGVGGHMSMLERTRIGSSSVSDAVTLDQLRSQGSLDDLAKLLASISDVLSHLPAVVVDDADIRKALNGLAVSVEASAEANPARILTSDGDLIGIGCVTRADGGFVVKPRKVLASDSSEVI